MHTHDLTVEDAVVRKRFVSWDDGEPDREWAGLVALARQAPDLAPSPIARESAAESPVIVMSRVPGEPLGSTALTPAQHDGLVAALSRLFACRTEPTSVERTLGPSTMRPFVRTWARTDYAIDRCQDPGLVATAIGLAREWLADDDPHHDLVVDAVLSNGDGNLDNLMWDGLVCRLIDFEDFGISDPAYEVADLVEHASSRLRGLLDVDLLIDRLALTSAQHQRLTVFRRLMAAFWLVMLLPGNSGFTRNPAGSTEHQARHLVDLLG